MNKKFTSTRGKVLVHKRAYPGPLGWKKAWEVVEKTVIRLQPSNKNTRKVETPDYTRSVESSKKMKKNLF